jgi:hypothetical protein
MKSIILTTLFLAGFYAASLAQEVPRTEFSVTLSEQSITLKPGEAKQVRVQLLKSRAFSRAKASFVLSSGLPAGVSVAFDPTEGKLDESTATISVGKEALAGTYSIALGATMLGKKKGSLIKVEVLEGTAVSTSQN